MLRLMKNIDKLFKSLFLLTIFFPSAAIAAPLFNQPYKSYTLTPGKSGGRLVLALTSEPKSFNPIVAQEASTTEITSLIFEGLVRTNPLSLKVEPNLAKAWKVSKNGREYIFYLRDDIYFNDGVRLKADDVVFTFNELVYNPDIPTSSRDIFTLDGKKILVEKVDDLTVKFTLPSTFGPFLRAMSQEILPKHKYESCVKEKKFTFALGLNTPLTDIVGTGPFRLKKYLFGEQVIFEKNPYYWKKDALGAKLPYLGEVVFLILQSQDTSLLKFLDNELDYYPLRPADIAILGPLKDKNNFSLYNAGPSFGENFIVFNQTPGENPATKKPFVSPYKLRWFCSQGFRHAVSLAVDRKKMIDFVLNGLGEEQFSPLTKANLSFYSDNIVKEKYDPVEAKKILEGIGFADKDNDGFLEDKEGHRLEIDFYTNADNTERVQMAALVKTDLEKIGFKINFMPLDFNNLVVKLSSTNDWEMVFMGFTGGIEPYFGKNVWSYKGGLHVWNRSGKAIAGYEQEIEDIFEKSARLTDDKARKKLFDRWQFLVSSELPLIHTVVPETIYAIRNRFGNLYPTVFGGAFGELEYVYVK